MSKSAPREIELKLRLTPEEMEAALAGSALLALREEPRRRRLRTVYWDTADAALSRNGMALRIRDLGDARVQTLKAARDAASALLDVLEDEQPIAADRPNLDRIRDRNLRAAAAGAIGRRRLRPVFETDIDRREWTLSGEGGSTLFLAADKGTIRSGERISPICELEIEIREGSPADVFALARDVLGDQPLRLETRTKAERGFHLAAGRDITAPTAPETARLPGLTAGMTVEEGLRAALRSCLRQIAVNALACRENGDAEGPHQLRVGLRRLRSVLRIFRPVSDGDGARHLAAEAAWLAGEAGPARDLHVFGAEIVVPARALDPEAPDGQTGYDRLEAARSIAAEAAHARLAAALDDPRTPALILGLGIYAEGAGWRAEPDAPEDRAAACEADLAHFASGALDRLWRKVDKRARHLADLDEAERHELRKSLKKLRYGADLFAPLFPAKRVRTWVKSLKTLQDVFGYLNDVAVARALLADLAPPDSADGTLSRTHGLVLGVHAGRADAAWSEAQSRWRRLARTKPFWD
ncbi:CYTH and CHAD domain-containing protein [Futiania mangrovi]|uniref:CHAD domain-containing protein n=1 Tax=Futiania mangrovi TaxID=2959716 RepID=A0A9J6P999_9PROT|nr:CHAD domain-containing protein [Futiania mangrovii]MCP1336476.1 CHAD domain-containing protein [Futiania mangrovii]